MQRNSVPFRMTNETHSSEPDTLPDDQTGEPDDPKTSGHVERTVLHHMAGAAPAPTTLGAVLDEVAAVIERGGYGNAGPRGGGGAPLVQQSTVRRTFGQLAEKGLVGRVGDLPAENLRGGPVDLGDLVGEDPTDPAAYAATADDARVTDWYLTDAGRREVDRLDARYEAELDELAARYGRPRGETTERVEA